MVNVLPISIDDRTAIAISVKLPNTNLVMVTTDIGYIMCGALDVGLMLLISFPDKTTALLGAFASRFAIGFVIGCVQLPSWPGWVVGLLFGLLISLPDAIITHKYVPILILGGIGGLVIGGLIHGWRANI